MSKEKQLKQTKQKKDFTITPIEELPLGKRLTYSFYDTILDSVMKDTSGKKNFKIEVSGKNYKSIYAPIDIKIRKRRLPLKIQIRNKILYLQKLSSYEEVEKLRKVHKKKIKEPEKSK